MEQRYLIRFKQLWENNLDVELMLSYEWCLMYYETLSVNNKHWTVSRCLAFPLTATPLFDWLTKIAAEMPHSCTQTYNFAEILCVSHFTWRNRKTRNCVFSLNCCTLLCQQTCKWHLKYRQDLVTTETRLTIIIWYHCHESHPPRIACHTLPAPSDLIWYYRNSLGGAREVAHSLVLN